MLFLEGVAVVTKYRNVMKIAIPLCFITVHLCLSLALVLSLCSLDHFYGSHLSSFVYSLRLPFFLTIHHHPPPNMAHFMPLLL